MTAADAHQTLSVSPMIHAGRCWLRMDRRSRAKPLDCNGLPGFYRAFGWRELPKHVVATLEESFAAERSG